MMQYDITALQKGLTFWLEAGQTDYGLEIVTLQQPTLD